MCSVVPSVFGSGTSLFVGVLTAFNDVNLEDTPSPSRAKDKLNQIQPLVISISIITSSCQLNSQSFLLYNYLSDILIKKLNIN